MSKLARVLALGALLAATTLASTTAVAQAHTSNDPASTRHRALGQLEFLATDQPTSNQDGRRPPTEGQVGEPYHHRQVASQQATMDATRRAALAQEHYYSTWGYGDPAVQQALAQERYYSTWGYSNTPAPAPAKPSGPPSWLVPGLGVLAAAVALASGLAVLAAKRAGRRAQVRHAA